MIDILHATIEKYRYAVISTASSQHEPEAAVIGICGTAKLELIFDTNTESRKYRNLNANPKVALVIGGWEGEATIQYEGIAHELAGDELIAWKSVYFAKFPDGKEREKLVNIAYFLITPTWIRHSDFGVVPPRIEEVRF